MPWAYGEWDEPNTLRHWIYGFAIGVTGPHGELTSRSWTDRMTGWQRHVL